MNTSVLRAAVLFSPILAWCLRAADAKPEPARKIEISVERKRGDNVERMEPSHVFEPGELVRFRFQSNFNGFLYVMNHSTSSRYVALFPNGETGLDNRIQRNRAYLLPMTESGWFRIEGPSGYELVYWLVSPAKLNDPGSGSFEPPRLPADSKPLDVSITPRCDDAIFRARGECLDAAAGAAPVRDRQELPGNLAGMPQARPRELTVTKSDKKTAIITPAGDSTPFVYLFRLAHK